MSAAVSILGTPARGWTTGAVNESEAEASESIFKGDDGVCSG